MNQSPEDQMPNFFPTVSSFSAIQNTQSCDTILSVVKQWLLNGEKPPTIQTFRAPKEMVSYFKQFSLLKLTNGIIMRKWVPVKNKVEEDVCLICLPDENKEAVLQMYHASLMGNHPRIKLTLDICRRHYYWPGMSPDVELFVKACITCGRVKGQKKAHHSSSIQRHSRVRPHRTREAWSGSFRKQVYPQHDRCLLRIRCCCSHQQSKSRTKHCFDYA